MSQPDPSPFSCPPRPRLDEVGPILRDAALLAANFRKVRATFEAAAAKGGR